MAYGVQVMSSRNSGAERGHENDDDALVKHHASTTTLGSGSGKMGDDVIGLASTTAGGGSRTNNSSSSNSSTTSSDSSSTDDSSRGRGGGNRSSKKASTGGDALVRVGPDYQVSVPPFQKRVGEYYRPKDEDWEDGGFKNGGDVLWDPAMGADHAALSKFVLDDTKTTLAAKTDISINSTSRSEEFEWTMLRMETLHKTGYDLDRAWTDYERMYEQRTEERRLKQQQREEEKRKEREEQSLRPRQRSLRPRQPPPPPPLQNEDGEISKFLAWKEQTKYDRRKKQKQKQMREVKPKNDTAASHGKREDVPWCTLCFEDGPTITCCRCRDVFHLNCMSSPPSTKDVELLRKSNSWSCGTCTCRSQPPAAGTKKLPAPATTTSKNNNNNNTAKKKKDARNEKDTSRAVVYKDDIFSSDESEEDDDDDSSDEDFRPSPRRKRRRNVASNNKTKRSQLRQPPAAAASSSQNGARSSSAKAASALSSRKKETLFESDSSDNSDDDLEDEESLEYSHEKKRPGRFEETDSDCSRKMYAPQKKVKFSNTAERAGLGTEASKKSTSFKFSKDHGDATKKRRRRKNSATSIVYPQPRGRPKKDCVWDGMNGVWMPLDSLGRMDDEPGTRQEQNFYLAGKDRESDDYPVLPVLEKSPGDDDNENDRILMGPPIPRKKRDDATERNTGARSLTFQNKGFDKTHSPRNSGFEFLQQPSKDESVNEIPFRTKHPSDPTNLAPVDKSSSPGRELKTNFSLKIDGRTETVVAPQPTPQNTSFPQKLKHHHIKPAITTKQLLSMVTGGKRSIAFNQP